MHWEGIKGAMDAKCDEPSPDTCRDAFARGDAAAAAAAEPLFPQPHLLIIGHFVVDHKPDDCGEPLQCPRIHPQRWEILAKF